VIESRTATRTGPDTEHGRPDVALTYLYAFRRVVVGLALLGAAFAWVVGAPWLLAICVFVGLGELLESSSYIAVLRRAPPGRAGRQDPRPPKPYSEGACRPDAWAGALAP
jgi:hypothetical protein